jgi:hypothetical protein
MEPIRPGVLRWNHRHQLSSQLLHVTGKWMRVGQNRHLLVHFTHRLEAKLFLLLPANGRGSRVGQLRRLLRDQSRQERRHHGGEEESGPGTNFQRPPHTTSPENTCKDVSLMGCELREQEMSEAIFAGRRGLAATAARNRERLPPGTPVNFRPGQCSRGACRARNRRPTRAGALPKQHTDPVRSRTRS